MPSFTFSNLDTGEEEKGPHTHKEYDSNVGGSPSKKPADDMRRKSTMNLVQNKNKLPEGGSRSIKKRGTIMEVNGGMFSSKLLKAVEQDMQEQKKKSASKGKYASDGRDAWLHNKN